MQLCHCLNASSLFFFSCSCHGCCGPFKVVRCPVVFFLHPSKPPRTVRIFQTHHHHLPQPPTSNPVTCPLSPFAAWCASAAASASSPGKGSRRRQEGRREWSPLIQASQCSQMVVATDPGLWNWRTVLQFKWQRDGHINELEMRAYLAAFQWRLRNKKQIRIVKREEKQ